MPFNSVPYEIIAAPFEMWIAAVATAFPLVSAAPGAGWAKVGTSGDFNYTEDGVSVEHSETIAFFRSLASGGPRKAWRTEESLILRLQLADLSLEQYALALNHNGVATVAAGAGTPGKKTIGLSRGLDVVQKALLLRGPSPHGDGYNAQYEVPIAVQTGKPKIVFRKNEPAGIELEWTALEDPNATAVERFGRLVAQTAAPL